jgi:ribonuclease J
MVIDEVPAGRLYVDGGVVTPENGDALRERRHAATNGMLTVSVALDGRSSLVSGPQVRTLGMPGDSDYSASDAADDMADEARHAFHRLSPDECDDDSAVEAAISRAVKKAAFRIWKRRPIVETTVLRV